MNKDLFLKLTEGAFGFVVTSNQPIPDAGIFSGNDFSFPDVGYLKTVSETKVWGVADQYGVAEFPLAFWKTPGFGRALMKNGDRAMFAHLYPTGGIILDANNGPAAGAFYFVVGSA